MELSSVKLSNNETIINSLTRDYVVSYYNGIDKNNKHCLTFKEFLEKEFVRKIINLTVEYDDHMENIINQVLETDKQIDNLSIKNWGLLEDKQKAEVLDKLALKNYLFESNDSELNAVLKAYVSEPTKIPTVLITSETTSTLGTKDKFSSDNMEIDDVFDKAVRYIGNHSKEKVFAINIGSMDGKTHDELSGYTAIFDFKGLYVEPIPYIFDILKSNFSEDNLFENSAITSYDGEIEMLTISPEPIEQGKIHQCFRGMSSIYPPKNGLISVDNKETVNRYGMKIIVPCLAFESLLKKHNISQFDILKIDAEGHDWEILKEVDLDKYRPSIIRIEWINLSEENKQEVLDKFNKHHYLYEMIYGDITAITEELYLKIIGKNKIVENPQPKEEPVNNLFIESGIKKKYKIECEISTVGDIFSLMYNTFSDITNLKVYPIVSAVPIRILDGECKTPDYTLFVYPDGISLVFDPISRENGGKFVLNKPLDEDVIKWLESMDSEQIYKMAQLTFTKL